MTHCRVQHQVPVHASCPHAPEDLPHTFYMVLRAVICCDHKVPVTDSEKLPVSTSLGLGISFLEM